MRLLFTSTSYPAGPDDWRGVFILRMLEGLAKRDDLQVAAWCPPGDLPGGVANALQSDDERWLREMTNVGGIAHLLRTRPVLGVRTGLGLVERIRRACNATDADLFHLNWLQSALGLPRSDTPAVVTVLGTDLQILGLPFVRALLARRFSGRRVTLCPNADWMVPILEKRFRSSVRVRCMPFGIDARWYQVERRVDRNTPPRWLCVTRLTPGKLGPLLEWAEAPFGSGERELHLIGPLQDRTVRIPDWVKYHGPAPSEELRTRWFPTATGLISLSTHPEGRPQVMLEAMAAGLPLIASANPAHLDLIRDGRTGRICKDPADFSAALSSVETPAKNAEFGAAARSEAQRRFGTWDDCAARYAAIYKELVS